MKKGVSKIQQLITKDNTAVINAHILRNAVLIFKWPVNLFMIYRCSEWFRLNSFLISNFISSYAVYLLI